MFIFSFPQKNSTNFILQFSEIPPADVERLKKILRLKGKSFSVAIQHENWVKKFSVRTMWKMKQEIVKHCAVNKAILYDKIFFYYFAISCFSSHFCGFPKKLSLYIFLWIIFIFIFSGFFNNSEEIPHKTFTLSCVFVWKGKINEIKFIIGHDHG